MFMAFRTLSVIALGGVRLLLLLLQLGKSQVTGQVPTSTPSAPPTTNQLTVSPSLGPSWIPSNCPSLLPLNPPSWNPTIIPSIVPSISPTFIPSLFPSSAPTTSPSILPSSIPSNTPTSEPTLTPTNSPTRSPSCFPTVIPSFPPSSIPSFPPSNIPSFSPSVEPTFSPSANPSFPPTINPTLLPSVSPSCLPTASPSIVPTFIPSNRPSLLPSFSPSITPTSPSYVPTTVPSVQPTSQPSQLPSAQPFSHPSSEPSDHPSGQPSSRPTRQPSVLPSMQPLSRPSTHPSQQPSVQPSSTPSQPTGNPTSLESYRELNCGECESVTASNGSAICNFYTPKVMLLCPPAKRQNVYCSYEGYSLLILNSSIVINGSCPFVVSNSDFFNMTAGSLSSNDPITISSHGLIILAQSSIVASKVNITSFNMIMIGVASLIQTSALGPLGGPGSSNFSGGSYGGSGGVVNSSCPTFFSATNYQQIGSVEVLSDVLSPTANMTSGSGGGDTCMFNGHIASGRGGGQIYLSSPSTSICGSLLANGGSPSLGSSCSAGSGGSIVVLGMCASSLTLCLVGGVGIISAAGGDVTALNHSSNCVGAAGGGGRIQINFLISTPSVNLVSLMDYVNKGSIVTRGGVSSANSRCSTGGAGTLFVKFTGTNYSAVVMSNSMIKTSAVTLVQNWPNGLLGIFASGGPVVSVTSTSFVLQTPDLCVSPFESFGFNSCSFLFFTGASILLFQDNVEAAATESTMKSKSQVLSVAVSNISFQSHSLFLNYQQKQKVQVTCSNFTVSRNSNVSFTNLMSITSSDTIAASGSVIQNSLGATSGPNSGLLIDGYRVSLGYSSIRNLNVIATNLSLNGDVSLLLPTGPMATNCFRGSISQNVCNNKSPLLGNGTILVAASSFVGVYGNIDASAILICSNNTVIGTGVKLFTLGLGCPCGQGYGAGVITSTGGGGYGGNGGGSGGGVGYYSAYNFSSGSGGAGSCQSQPQVGGSTAGYGGGLIALQSRYKLLLYGNLSSSGSYSTASPATGGGSGGTIYLAGTILQINGALHANGGRSSSGGGGGGGGLISINIINPNLYALSNLTGTFEVNGGTSDIADNVGYNGIINWPSCPPGWGGLSGYQGDFYHNAYDTKFCGYCVAGTYSSEYSPAVCQPCTNAGQNGVYINCNSNPSVQGGCSSSNCLDECNTGFISKEADDDFLDNHPLYYCESTFQAFLNSLGGIKVFVSIVICVFFLLIMPLMYAKCGRRYIDFGARSQWLIRRHNDLFGILSKRKVNLDENLSVYLDPNDHKKQQFNRSIDYKLSMESVRPYNFITEEDENELIRRKLEIADSQRKNAKTIEDMRLAFKISDLDLPSHACRVYIAGRNHPLMSMGGPWRLPTSRPVCLRPMIDRRQYNRFAEDITSKLKFSVFSFEYLWFLLLSVSFPPFSAAVMSSLRYYRAEILIEAIANCDHSIFRSRRQRKALNSLRIGISPDSTLAYIDFLFDINTLEKRKRPLCPIGQPKLPIAFQLAGLGTYFTPWYLDTNDFILQSIPHTDAASLFIDKAWIAFVVELNSALRTISISNPSLGLIRLIKFLSDTRISSTLGGLIVELCTFETVIDLLPSDVAKDKYDELLQAENILQNNPSFGVNGLGTLDGGGFEHRKSDDMNWFTPLEILADKFTVNLTRLSDPRQSDATSKQPSASISSSTTMQNGQSSNSKTPKSILGVKSKNLSKTSGQETNLKPTFLGMCTAVADGRICLGIRVSHQKVDNQSFIFNDEDYFSGDSDDEKIHLAILDEKTPALDSVIHELALEESTGDASDQKILLDRRKSLFGAKHAEVSKFYDIMKKVDLDFAKLSPSCKILSDVDEATCTTDLPAKYTLTTTVNPLLVRSSDTRSPLRNNDMMSVDASGYFEFNASRQKTHTMSHDDIEIPSIVKVPSRPTLLNQTTASDTHVVNFDNVLISNPEGPFAFEVSKFAVNEERNHYAKSDGNRSFPRFRSSISQSLSDENQRPLTSYLSDLKHLRRDFDPSLLAPSTYQQRLTIWKWDGKDLMPVISEAQPESNNDTMQSNSEVNSITIMEGSVKVNRNRPSDYSEQSRYSNSVQLTVRSSHLEKELLGPGGEEIQIGSQNIANNLCLGGNFTSIFHYRLYDTFAASFTANLFTGCNVYPIFPVGSRNIRQIAAAGYFVMSSIDIMLTAVVTAYIYFIKQTNGSTFSKTTSWILMYTIWPGALIFAPVFGIYAIILGPSGFLSRMHASWLRLSFISSWITLAIFIAFNKTFNNPQLSFVFHAVIALVCTKTVQILLIDLYIAHVERIRFTRGWDGLHTSLYATEDNLDIFDE